jgi:hypothetical protein
MLTAEQTATLLGISRRTVYQFVETGSAHFAETETGAVMICLSSLIADPDKGVGFLPAATTDPSP